MLVKQIDVSDLAVNETEDDAPVVIHAQGPEARAIALQGVQPPSGQVEFVWGGGGPQCSQDVENPRQAVGGQPGGVAGFCPAAQTLVADRDGTIIADRSEKIR